MKRIFFDFSKENLFEIMAKINSKKGNIHLDSNTTNFKKKFHSINIHVI